MWSRRFGALVLVFLAMMAAPLFALWNYGKYTPAPPEISAAAPETVIVVIACTLRADRLGLYGNPLPTSPYLDRLGASGVVFDSFLSNAPWTRPAVASLITGRYPLVMGVDDPRPILGSSRGVDPGFNTLAESFAAASWHTVGATSNPNANAFFGMDQGFEVYDEATGLWREDRRKVVGQDLIRPFLDAIRERSGKVYGQILLVDTHAPRSPGPLERAWVDFGSLFRPNPLFVYDASVRQLDGVLRALDAGLAAMGRGQRLLVLVGDHGEGLNTPEHAGAVHGRYLYDPAVRVPWILHGPGVAAGRRVGGLAEGVDVSPTVLDLAGVPPLGSADGDSRAAVARGEAADTGETRVFSETFFSDEHKLRWSTPEWTLIHRPGDRRHPAETELYAADDRNQTRDLASQNAQQTGALLAEALAFRAPLLAAQVVWQTGEDDLTVKRQLRELGYLE